MAACRASLARPPLRCARLVRASAAAAPAPASPYLRLAADNPHISHAWALPLPRLYEATRRRGVLHDPLLPRMLPAANLEAAQQAASLCAEALAAQRAVLESSAYEPPPGRRLGETRDTPLCIRGVALDAFMDAELAALAHTMAKQQLLDGDGGCACVQVIALGCGFDTRPWRLPLPHVRWFDVDLPPVLQEKEALLAAAGAELARPPPHCDLQPPAGAGGVGVNGQGGKGGVPLLVGRYCPVVTHMLKGDWTATLEGAGWDPHGPTIWLVANMLHALDTRAVDRVMGGIDAASRHMPCAAWVGSVLNAAMVDLISETLAGGGGGGGQVMPPGGLSSSSLLSLDMPNSLLSLEAEEAPAADVGVKWGCRRDAASFLHAFGWDQVEEITPWDLECLLGFLTVGLEPPPATRRRLADRYGQEPLWSVGVGRRRC